MEPYTAGWRGKKARFNSEGETPSRLFAPDRLRPLWSRSQESPATVPENDSGCPGKCVKAGASARELFDGLRAMVMGQWAGNSAHLGMLEGQLSIIESMLGRESDPAAIKPEMVEQLALLEDLLESLLLEDLQ